MKISKNTLIFIGILAIFMSLSLIIAYTYVQSSGGQDITLDSIDRSSEIIITTREPTTSDTEPYFPDTTVPNETTVKTTIETTGFIVVTTEVETTRDEITTEATTKEEETTVEETTVEETTAEETTVEETTIEETTAEETTIEETTAEETTSKITSEEITTEEVTTQAPETTEHVHKYSGWKTTKNPGCETEGTRTRECSCGEKQSKPIEAQGHKITKIAATEATCKKNGYTEGEKCSICSKIFKKQTLIPKLECKYENLVCIYCGEYDTIEIALTTQFAGLYKADTLKCLYSIGADTKLAPASLTKMITACVAIENMPLNTVITVGSELSLVPKYSSLCYIYQGQRLKLSDLLTGMLLCSGNDAAYVIAANVGRYASGKGSLSDQEAVAYFCSLMNDYAKKIGAKNSQFTTPDGSDSEGQYSTVNDLAIITNNAMKNKTIAEITSTHYKKVVFTSGQIAKWTNTNELINPDSRYYTECVSGFKTGGTEMAGKCLSATFTKNGVEYIAIVIGCEDNDARYENILELINSVK